MYGLKVYIVGEANAGKTLLAKRLIVEKKEDFKFSAMYSPTVGFHIHSPKARKKDKHYEVSIWDTGGEEAYRSARELSAKDSAIFVYCVDVSSNLDAEKQGKQLTSIREEVKLLKFQSPHAKFIIVGTKCDTENQKKNGEYLNQLTDELSATVVFDSSKNQAISAIDTLNNEFVQLTEAKNKKCASKLLEGFKAQLEEEKKEQYKRNPEIVNQGPFNPDIKKTIDYPASYQKLWDKTVKNYEEKLDNRAQAQSPAIARRNLPKTSKYRSSISLLPEQNYYCALALFKDYCKMDDIPTSQDSKMSRLSSSIHSWFRLASTCHLGRHHVKTIRNFLQKYESRVKGKEELKNVNNFLTDLQAELNAKKICPNLKGSLQTRIDFIRNQIEDKPLTQQYNQTDKGKVEDKPPTQPKDQTNVGKHEVDSPR